MSDSSLRLARDLKLRSREQLIALVTQRKIAGAHIRDFFDMADALLDADSVTDALGRVPRPTLVRLAFSDLHPDDQVVPELGLATRSSDGELLALDEVTLAARTLIETRIVSKTDESPNDTAEATTDDTLDRPGIERGLLLTTAIDDLAQSIASSPVRRLASGNLAAADSVRLGLNIEHTGLHLADALGFALNARLIHLVDSWYLGGPHFAGWQLSVLVRRSGEPCTRLAPGARLPGRGGAESTQRLGQQPDRPCAMDVPARLDLDSRARDRRCSASATPRTR